VKIKIQIPDSLYREAKRIALENETSFAEVVRRGLEEIVVHYPSGRNCNDRWTPPKPFNFGKTLAPESEWTGLCHD